jgi:hypothetical protein
MLRLNRESPPESERTEHALEAVARIVHHLAGLAPIVDLFASSGTLNLESSVFSQTPRPGAARPDRPAPGPRLMRQQR